MAEESSADGQRRTKSFISEEEELDLALGRMVHKAAMAEFFLHQLVRRLVGGQYAALLTAGMQATAVLDAVKRITDTGAVSEEAVQQMNHIIERSRKAFAERNKYVHGLRVYGEPNQLLTNNRRRGHIDQWSMEADSLMDLATEFSKITGRYVTWQREHLEGLPPLGRQKGGKAPETG
jgi:uncharacterized membrane protein